eukprot:8595453-Alexandrium_andersonii.AAC.1
MSHVAKPIMFCWACMSLSAACVGTSQPRVFTFKMAAEQRVRGGSPGGGSRSEPRCTSFHARASS